MFSFFKGKQQINVADGLVMLQDKEGYYLIKQEGFDETLLVTNTEQKGVAAAEELETLYYWVQDYHVLQEIEKNEKLMRLYVEIKERYETKRTPNGTYLQTLTSDNQVQYFLFEEGHSQNYERVRGFHITEGLAVHEKNDGRWSIDHVTSCHRLSEVGDFSNAVQVARTLETILDWRKEDVPELLMKFDDLRMYFKGIKESVEEIKPFPKMPEILEYRLLFEQNPSLSERWDVFYEAWLDLNDMIGLDEVKYGIKRLAESIRGELINQGKVKGKKARLHMMFMGNAGTGKTQVARIIGKLLYALGYLTSNHCVEADRSSIVGVHVGETEKNTKALVEEAMGGVLFIDEAYALAKEGNDFGQEAVNVLIKAMEDKYDKFVVILAGYNAEMNRLLEMNSGFESRIGKTYKFADYTPKQLVEIGKRMVEYRGYTLHSDAVQTLELELRKKAEKGVVKGNARTIEKLMDTVVEELNIRVGRGVYEKTDTTVIVEEDIKVAFRPTSIKDEEGLLEIRKKAIQKIMSLVGMEKVKEKVNEMAETLPIQQMKYNQGLITEKPRLHMIFSGPPGTGKTTVARDIGAFLRGIGSLSSGHFVEVSRADLVGKYQGHTAQKTREVIQQALGGVLFIDEAYALKSGEGDSFGAEAIAELIDAMEKKKEDLVVILAGYEKHMNEMLETNPGFRSRIGMTFEFTSYTKEDIVAITKVILKQQKIRFEDAEAVQMVENMISYYHAREGAFEGNGRWASRFVRAIVDEQEIRLSKKAQVSEEDLITVKKEDIENAIETM